MMLAAMIDNPDGVLLIEGNHRPGAKISISGGGRCNLTNEFVAPEDYLGCGVFVSQVLSKWDQHDTLGWFDQRGLEYINQKDNQYFCSHSSSQIMDILLKETKELESRYGCIVTDAIYRDDRFTVSTTCGIFTAEKLVIATGGLSYPKLGASGIGYEIAENFGHTVTTPSPALVGLTLQSEQFFLKSLSGISTKVAFRIEDKKVQGQMLLTHKGISGPAVLDLSLYWKKGKVVVEFLPDFDWRSIRGSKKQISTLLPIPRRLSKALLEHLDISDKPANKLSSEEILRLKEFNNYSFAPAGTFGYSRAEVTRGGVAAEGIDPNTMESKLQKNLFVIGEVLDVTGRLGGYNLQWAFCTAAVCAKAFNAAKIQ